MRGKEKSTSHLPTPSTQRRNNQSTRINFNVGKDEMSEFNPIAFRFKSKHQFLYSKLSTLTLRIQKPDLKTRKNKMKTLISKNETFLKIWAILYSLSLLPISALYAPGPSFKTPKNRVLFSLIIASINFLITANLIMVMIMELMVKREKE